MRDLAKEPYSAEELRIIEALPRVAAIDRQDPLGALISLWQAWYGASWEVLRRIEDVRGLKAMLKAQGVAEPDKVAAALHVYLFQDLHDPAAKSGT